MKVELINAEGIQTFLITTYYELIKRLLAYKTTDHINIHLKNKTEISLFTNNSLIRLGILLILLPGYKFSLLKIFIANDDEFNQHLNRHSRQRYSNLSTAALIKKITFLFPTLPKTNIFEDVGLIEMFKRNSANKHLVEILVDYPQIIFSNVTVFRKCIEKIPLIQGLTFLKHLLNFPECINKLIRHEEAYYELLDDSYEDIQERLHHISPNLLSYINFHKLEKSSPYALPQSIKIGIIRILIQRLEHAIYQKELTLKTIIRIAFTLKFNLDATTMHFKYRGGCYLFLNLILNPNLVQNALQSNSFTLLELEKCIEFIDAFIPLIPTEEQYTSFKTTLSKLRIEFLKLMVHSQFLQAEESTSVAAVTPGLGKK